jgi:hypothetical protein
MGYLTTLYYIASYGRTIDEWWIGKNLEGRKNRGTNPVFGWMGWGKPQEASDLGRDINWGPLKYKHKAVRHDQNVRFKYIKISSGQHAVSFPVGVGALFIMVEWAMAWRRQYTNLHLELKSRMLGGLAPLTQLRDLVLRLYLYSLNCIFFLHFTTCVSYPDLVRSRDRSGCIATGYGLDGRCSIPGRVKKSVLHRGVEV